MRFAHFEFDPATDKLGEGPSSEVYRAVDERLGRTVALKILRPHVEFDPLAKERFEREAKHAGSLTHANIAVVFEYGEDKGTSFIAMEFLEGRTLDKLLLDRALGMEEGMRMAMQVSSALAVVHAAGLIHRDLKPANLMVMPDGTIKLLDFGICRSTADSQITQEGMLVGTVLYMAPEQVLGENLDLRSDIFALGAVLYHAFTGVLPFPGKSFPEVCMAILEAEPAKPSTVRQGLPQPLEHVILHCLSRDPDKRYEHGGVLFAALQAAADSMRLSSSSEHPESLQGRILIPPFTSTGSAANGFASGVRSDLRVELARSTNLEVSPGDEELLPMKWTDAYVLRTTLALDGNRAKLDYVLERDRNGGPRDGETTHIWRETIEQEDDDEWGLQAKLVSTLVRTLKRRLTEFSLAPPPSVLRRPAEALALTRRAHNLLHRGSSKHLMAAIASFRRAFEEDPGCALAHAGLAEALVRKFYIWNGDRTFLRESRQESQRALALEPFSAEAHTSLGYSHIATGESTEAQRELRLAIQIDHEEWLAHRLLGALLSRLGNDEAAAPLLHRAIALHPVSIQSFDDLYQV
ncbi:MAG: serine/threonine protein kinase, partial [Planctomycetota bacterium]